MTKREFVEQAAMRIYASAVDIAEEDAVTEALALWDEIEKQVPYPQQSEFVNKLFDR